MTAKESRYEVLVYDEEGNWRSRFSDDRAEAEKYASMNGGVMIDTETGYTKMWL